ncbi:MAG: hypothetical protein ACR2H0_06670 [Candidatus Limnocylindrales bacterium]
MKRNAVEWAVIIISVLSIAVLVGVLVIEGLSESRPPNPTIEMRQAEAREGALGWIVPVTVNNDGDQAAEAVVIEASATIDGETESSEQEINFLPAGSEVELAFAFSAVPEGDVTFRLVGYRVP